MSILVQTIASGIVVTTGIYLIVLGAASLVRPAMTRRILLGFAQSAPVHYIEMAGRVLVGIALVVASARMLFAHFFFWFGVALLVSSAMLLCLPWTLHRSMGERVLPKFVRFLSVVGPVSLLLGGLFIAATAIGAG